MKKTISILGAVILSITSFTLNAQQTWDAKKNPTVDSLTSGYEAKLVPPPQPLTTEKIFPVLGQYESSANADAASITITLDELNKGIVWIQGLPQGKIKAMLRKSPATYKIPAQKTEEGKDVAEGTLIFDKETNSLSICIGKAFNTADPASAFTQAAEETAVVTTNDKSVKSKKISAPKPWMYVGTKVDKGTVMN
jgi:hypothetical protein